MIVKIKNTYPNISFHGKCGNAIQKGTVTIVEMRDGTKLPIDKSYIEEAKEVEWYVDIESGQVTAVSVEDAEEVYKAKRVAEITACLSILEKTRRLGPDDIKTLANNIYETAFPNYSNIEKCEYEQKTTDIPGDI